MPAGYFMPRRTPAPNPSVPIVENSAPAPIAVLERTWSGLKVEEMHPKTTRPHASSAVENSMTHPHKQAPR